MNINTAFPSKYLKESDLAGAQPIVTIARVTVEEIGQGGSKERKPVVYFEGKTKGMVCNKTNATMIARIANTHETDDWPGVKIRLVSAEVEFQGQLTQAIRVRPASNASKPPTQPTPRPVVSESEPDLVPPDEDEIPF